LGEQMPPLSALDSFGEVYEAILRSMSAIEASLDGLPPGCVICSGGTVASVNASAKAGAEPRQGAWCRPPP
jgi:hypothetical protein